MKKTALYNCHVALGAKMIPFAGFEMPVEYQGITAEHLAVRQGAGVFDVSHMGEFWVRGEQAFSFLQKITTNDVAQLTDGKVQYTCLPNGKGGIVDDLLVYRMDANNYLLVVNAANIQKDWDWCQLQNSFGVSLENVSDTITQLAVQGPMALSILQSLTQIDLSAIPYYSFKIGDFAGLEHVIISHTGYTGAGGFELYVSNNDALHLWNAVFSAGKNVGIVPVGLGARDTLRLEMGYCLYGNDIDDTTSPIEAGLGWITKFIDNKDFINMELFVCQKLQGVERRLCGFKMIDKGIPRNGYEIVDSNEQSIGIVTSGSISPILQCGIGMGYIQLPHDEIGKSIYIKVRQKHLKAEIVKMPFISNYKL
jgi:aminomethyltransferase